MNELEYPAAGALPAALERRLAALLEQNAGRPVLAALDGRCGSGKTTLAAAAAARFAPCAVIHTDDYYLPPAQRVPGWQEIPCANMDLERLRAEILEPARAGRPLRCRAYSCREGRYLAPRELAPQPLLLVEGSYSCHPSLAAFYDLRVFVTCPPAEQERRLRAREGAHYAAFAARWIPLEERYFAQYRIEQLTDLVLDTAARG